MSVELVGGEAGATARTEEGAPLRARPLRGAAGAAGAANEEGPGRDLTQYERLTLARLRQAGERQATII